MDQTTYENWLKVKEALEEAGMTDSYYYKRAAQIVATRQDPGPGI